MRGLCFTEVREARAITRVVHDGRVWEGGGGTASIRPQSASNADEVRYPVYDPLHLGSGDRLGAGQRHYMQQVSSKDAERYRLYDPLHLGSP